MFVSIIHGGNIGWNEEARQVQYSNTLVDTDFQCELISSYLPSHHGKVGLIVREYEKRKLAADKIALNIVLYVLFLVRFFGFEFRSTVRHIDLFVPEFDRYRNEVKRYADMMEFE